MAVMSRDGINPYSRSLFGALLGCGRDDAGAAVDFATALVGITLLACAATELRTDDVADGGCGCCAGGID